MVDWRKFLETTGAVVRGVSAVAIINNWLQMNDRDAFASIAAQVSSSSTEVVDDLDAVLLSTASASFNADRCRRLIKFYTIFKIAELERYQEWRGFPSS
jgi:hypothetical protein